ncbi:MAG: hypothetical protein MZU95_11690 [Desulfomicrobium escambiense]|nr:hypothetical protein [Desulfomicrobium escambiense]
MIASYPKARPELDFAERCRAHGATSSRSSRACAASGVRRAYPLPVMLDVAIRAA